MNKEEKKYKTQRGFTRIDFKDLYNQECSIQESSNIIPSIWIGVGTDRMILDRKMARRIGNRLVWFGYGGKI